MTIHVTEDSNPIGPVMQFSLLIVPIVMNGFFMVYSLTGWILQGRDKLNWSLEAESVSLWVCGGMLGFGMLSVAYTWLCGGKRWHLLVLSSTAHVVVAMLLTLSVFVTVRL